MFCASCGTQVSDTASFCAQCGSATAAAPPRLGAERPGIAPMVALGFLVGGFIGFLMRPSVLLMGQLPFGMVVTRGSSLSGLDQLLIPAAQQSFNIMLLGAVLGAAAGLGLSRVLAQRRS